MLETSIYNPAHGRSLASGLSAFQNVTPLEFHAPSFSQICPRRWDSHMRVVALQVSKCKWGVGRSGLQAGGFRMGDVAKSVSVPSPLGTFFTGLFALPS